MNRLLPPPTPQDIEAALTDIRNGTNVYGRWILFSDDLKNQDEGNAEADRLPGNSVQLTARRVLSR
jgi:hypothetical protein